MEARNAVRPRRINVYENDNSNNRNHSKRSYRMILEEIAVSSGGELSSSCRRLLKTLGDAAKTMNRIQELYQLRRENAEYLQDIPVSSQRPLEADASDDEDINDKFLQDNLASPHGPSEEDSNKGDDKNAKHLQDIPVPLQEPSDADDEDEDNNVELLQDIPVPPQGHVKAEARKDTKTIAELFQKLHKNSIEGNRHDYKTESLQDLKESRERLEPFRVIMDVSNFLPSEVDVKILGENLVIHGKHEKVIEYHGEVSREFTRQFEIPEDVDVETFRALFDCYGVLTVEASRKSMNSEDGTLDLLVYHEGTGNQQVLPSLEKLGNEEFEKLLKMYVKDGEEMTKFAVNLSKQEPSCYIPIDEVI